MSLGKYDYPRTTLYLVRIRCKHQYLQSRKFKVAHVFLLGAFAAIQYTF